MSQARYVLLIVLLLLSSGCAEMIATTRPDQIKQSQYRAELTSNEPAKEVSSCMKETLRHHTDANGKSPYEGITYRDFEKDSEIVLRMSHTYLVSGPELLFLIRNVELPQEGTKSTTWVNPMLLGGGGSQGYLDRLMNVIRPCAQQEPSHRKTLKGGSSHVPVSGNTTSGTNPTGASSSGAGDDVKMLEQLKNLHERGVITTEEFEKKKKEILERM